MAKCLSFFLAAHNLLLSHGKAWHVYDKEFRNSQKGRVSIVLNANWYFPQEKTEVFIQAAKRAMEFFLGWFANPIYVNGDYPEVMKTLIAEHSELEGVPNRYYYIKPFSVFSTHNIREFWIRTTTE